MAAFSLWQLLNQRQPFGTTDDDADPTQQRQAAGQAIGQSLIDMWNRADADAAGAVSDDDTNPYINHLIDYPDAPGRSSAQLQILPYYPSDGAGLRFTPLDSLLAAENPVPDPGGPRSEGQGGGSTDPNIQSVQWQGQAIRGGSALIGRYGPVILGPLLKAWQDAQKYQPGPEWPSPFSPPDQTPTSPAPVDPGTSGQDVNPTVPGVARQTASSSSLDGNADDASPAPDPTESLSPEARDAALIAMGLRVKPTRPQRPYVPGDFSGGAHGDLVQAAMDAARQKGCRVEPEIGFGAPGTSRRARADWVEQCPPRNPNVHEGKTNEFGDYTDNQNLIYDRITKGGAFSTSPRVQTFGYQPYQPLPPWRVVRHWRKYPSNDIDVGDFIKQP